MLENPLAASALVIGRKERKPNDVPRGEAAAQERFDFVRLFIEKLCQEFSGGKPPKWVLVQT